MPHHPPQSTADLLPSLHPVPAPQLILGQPTPLPVILSLVPIMVGVAAASAAELSFNWMGEQLQTCVHCFLCYRCPVQYRSNVQLLFHVGLHRSPTPLVSMCSWLFIVPLTAAHLCCPQCLLLCHPQRLPPVQAS